LVAGKHFMSHGKFMPRWIGHLELSALVSFHQLSSTLILVLLLYEIQENYLQLVRVATLINFHRLAHLINCSNFVRTSFKPSPLNSRQLSSSFDRRQSLIRWENYSSSLNLKINSHPRSIGASDSILTKYPCLLRRRK
jgi:hypothetical protein